jgi:arsenate reductase
MIHLYGIANCDTMKKARAWLDRQGLAYQFHDYKKEGVNREQLQRWCDELGWEPLLNRRGTTWRKLPEDVRKDIHAEAALRIMEENPSIIKRPILDTGTKRLLGFNENDYAALLD